MLVLKTEVREASFCLFLPFKIFSPVVFGLLNTFGMMNEVFGDMRLSWLLLGMFISVWVPAACVKQW